MYFILIVTSGDVVRTSKFIAGKPDYMYHVLWLQTSLQKRDMIITHLLFKNTIHEFLYL